MSYLFYPIDLLVFIAIGYEAYQSYMGYATNIAVVHPLLFDVAALAYVMARKWQDLQDGGTDFNFVFASEESFGYMTHDKARDKDAVGAIAMMNEITLFHKLQGKTLVDALDDIYDKYGYAQESLIANTYPGLEGRDKINNIMRIIYYRSSR